MRRKWIVNLIGPCILFVLVAAAPARAQNARGTILGHIQDPSGAPIPNAKVTAANLGTGISNTFSTTSTGDFVFVNLIPGTYSVQVKANGFKAVTSAGLILQVDQTLRQDFTLQVGELAQQVTVSAASQMVQTDNATIGEVVSEHFMQALPLNGRDFTSLIAINAGVTQPAGGIQTTIFDQHGLNDSFREMSIDGARPSSISYLINGITDSDFFFSKPTNIPSEYSVQEFKLQNGLYSAEYGNGSAQVNVAIKSGTNQLHGNAYDFIRNDAFQPDSPVIAALNQMHGSQIPTKTPLKQNQFGFTLGGPVIVPKLYNGRNRTFWFGSYEGGRRRTGGGVAQAQVPTAAEKTGDFTDWPYPIYDPSTTGSLAPVACNPSNLSQPCDPSGRAQFVSNGKPNVIPSGDINPTAQKIVAYMPTANVSCTLPCLNWTGPAPSSAINSDIFTGRVDQNFSSKDQLSYTMIVSRDNQTFPSFIPTSGSVAFSRSRLFGLGWQHSFGAAAFNEARFGYNREFFHEGAVTAFGPNLSAQLGLGNTTTNPAMFGLPNVSVGDGYLGLGNGNNGYSQKDNIYQYLDNLKFIRSKHTFTIGGDIRRVQLSDVDGFTMNGGLNFRGAYTASDPTQGGSGKPGQNAGNAFADLLLGYPLTVGAPVPIASDIYDLRGTSMSFFFQDDYRLTPRLSLNLGLRYELPSGLHSTDNSGAVLNPKTPGGGVNWVSQSFVNTVGPGSNDPSGQARYFQCCVTNQLVPRDTKDFAPRIGVAWRPLSTDRFVVRAGYGLFYDSFMRFYDGTNFDSNSLFTLQSNPNYPVANGSEKVSPLALNGLWLPPITFNPFTTLPPGYLFGIQTEWPGNHMPYNQQWSLDTQYALTPTLLADLSYVGSHAIHEPVQFHFNEGAPPPVAGDPCNIYRSAVQAPSSCLTDPNFVPVDQRNAFSQLSSHSFANANILSSTYNAMQLRVSKRFSQGLQFMANYTWSRSLDEISEIAAFNGSRNFLQNALDPHNNYGPADFDQTHRLVLSYSYDVPVGKGLRWSLGRADWFLGGWSTSGIVTFASGLPESVFCCTRGNDQFGNVFQDRIRAQINGDPNSGFTKSVLQWFNPSVFSTPVPGTFGNAGRNIIRVPGQRMGDISFVKQTPITERQRIEYRLEIYNVFSSWHSGQVFPNNTLYSSPAGCTPGPSGNCAFGSLVPLNGLGALNLWNPRIIQMALVYSF